MQFQFLWVQLGAESVIEGSNQRMKFELLHTL